MTSATLSVPRLVAGPRANGRDFGVIAQSPAMPLRDGQIEHITGINHQMIDWIGQFPLLHFFIPIRGDTGHWFLGTCKAQTPIAGNRVAITGGIVLHRDQLERIGWRADLLVSNRFDPEPVFADWLDPERRRTRLEPLEATFDGVPAPSATEISRFASLAPIINASTLPMVVIDPDLPLDAADAGRALKYVGNLLAAAPFERAEGLRWVTAPIFGPLHWDLAVSRQPPSEPHVAARVYSDRIELSGVDGSAWQTEVTWLDLLEKVRAFFPANAEVAPMLDDHRLPSGIADRLVSCLTYIRTLEGENPGGYAYWFGQLLVDFCATLAPAARRPFHEAAARLPNPGNALIRRMLVGGAEAPLRRAGYVDEDLARFAQPDGEPLALLGLLTASERRHAKVTEAEIEASDADCATLLVLAAERGADDPLFAGLIRSAADRPAGETPLSEQISWIIRSIPKVTAESNRSAEERLQIELDCANLLDRIGPNSSHSKSFDLLCRIERLGAFCTSDSAETDPLAIRDFVGAFVRRFGAGLTQSPI